MAAPQNAGLPDSLDLGGGYVIEFTALDVSSGADVTAVKVSLATLTIGNVSPSVGGPADLTADVQPLFIPIPFGPAEVTGAAGGPATGTATLVSLNKTVQSDPTVTPAEAQWANALTSVLAA